MNPDPFTLRELVWMVKKGKAASPADFNPFAPRPPVPVLKGKEMLAALKAAFIKERKR